MSGEYFKLQKNNVENRKFFDSWLMEKLNASEDGLNVSANGESKNRTDRQNKLMWQMFRVIGRQTGADVEEVHVACKLYIGQPILMADDEAWEKMWRENIKDVFTTEAKLKLISNIDVTRLFSTKQMNEFIDTVFRKYSELGIDWTSMIINEYQALAKTNG